MDNLDEKYEKLIQSLKAAFFDDMYREHGALLFACSNSDDAHRDELLQLLDLQSVEIQNVFNLFNTMVASVYKIKEYGVSADNFINSLNNGEVVQENQEVVEVPVEEIPVEVAPVEEAPVEEVPVEAALVEEVVQEAPAVEVNALEADEDISVADLGIEAPVPEEIGQTDAAATLGEENVAALDEELAEDNGKTKFKRTSTDQVKAILVSKNQYIKLANSREAQKALRG